MTTTEVREDTKQKIIKMSDNKILYTQKALGDERKNGYERLAQYSEGKLNTLRAVKTDIIRDEM